MAYYNPYGGYNAYGNYGAFQQQQHQQPQTIQQSGFVVVASEADVRSYPVAPGNAITFKLENAPICYVKTMGFSQLDSPTIERYRLVKEDNTDDAKQAKNGAESKAEASYAMKDDLATLAAEVDALKERLNRMEGSKDE